MGQMIEENLLALGELTVRPHIKVLAIFYPLVSIGGLGHRAPERYRYPVSSNKSSTASRRFLSTLRKWSRIAAMKESGLSLKDILSGSETDNGPKKAKKKA